MARRNLPPEEKEEAERMRRKAEKIMSAELYGGGSEIIEAGIPLISKAKRAERELVEDKYKEKLSSKEGLEKLYTDKEFKKLEGKIQRLFEALETKELSWRALFEYLGDFWEKFLMVDECLYNFNLIDRLMKMKYAMGPSMEVEQWEKIIEGLKGWSPRRIFEKIASTRKIKAWARNFKAEVGDLSEIRKKGIKREGNEKGVELSKKAFLKIHVVLLLLQDLAQFVENLYDYGEGIRVRGKKRIIAKDWKEGKLVVKGEVSSGAIGTWMKGGEIVVKGDVIVVGQGMKGGKIVVKGDARWEVGTEMKGGKIVVKGDARSLAGDGMKGGKIVIGGLCRDVIGRSMDGGILICKGKVNKIGRFHLPFQGGIILAEKGIIGEIYERGKNKVILPGDGKERKKRGIILAGGKEKKKYVENGVYHFKDLEKARKVAELLWKSNISLARPIEYKGPLDTENKTAEQIAEIILPRTIEQEDYMPI